MLTPKQKEFADEYLETGNGTKAALKTYDINAKNKENIAASMASQNLRKLKVKEYLESKAERASEVIFELLEQAKNETVKLNAGKDILDRAGFKPVDKQEHSGQVDIINKINYITPDGIDSTPDKETTSSISSTE